MQGIHRNLGIVGERNLPPPALCVAAFESMGKLNLVHVGIATICDKLTRYTYNRVNFRSWTPQARIPTIVDRISTAHVTRINTIV
jgi:hypothetical protein